jgi:alkylation response protein AidB-like acyl-CoA dehydrogenase
LLKDSVVHERPFDLPDDLAAQLRPACVRLEELAPTVGGVENWPADQIAVLGKAGILAWGLPHEFGGRSISELESLAAYEMLAASCLTTTFVLTQRNSACQRLANSTNDQLKSELLPRLCRGETFATVGISHLTTSRQHLGKAAVSALETDAGFLLNGTVPWVTGAHTAQHILTGGGLADGRQMLLSVPTSLEGVRIHEPMRLLALSASQTATVDLENVMVPRRYLLAGPIVQVMKHGSSGGAGSLTTSALALGATRATLGRLAVEAQHRSDLSPIYEALDTDYVEAAGEMYAVASNAGGPTPSGASAETVRQKANSLVVRAAQAFLAASKGAGFVVGHPAERAIREATFFLVWSCPQPVVAAALREFACVVGD